MVPDNKIPTAILKIHSPVLELPFRTTADHEVVFLAENLPPLGYRCYYFERNEDVIDRKRRSAVLKKIRKSKKYITRQANTVFDGQNLLNDAQEYDYVDDYTTTTEVVEDEPETKIIFGNVSTNLPKHTSPVYNIATPVPATRTTVNPKTTNTVPNTSTSTTKTLVNDTIKYKESDIKAITPHYTRSTAETTENNQKDKLETTTHDWYAVSDYDDIHVSLADKKLDHKLRLHNFYNRGTTTATTVRDQVTTTIQPLISTELTYETSTSAKVKTLSITFSSSCFYPTLCVDTGLLFKC